MTDSGTHGPEIAYRLDNEDRMIDVNDDFIRFAQENSASQLNRESLIGHSIWDFIADPGTRELYRLILRRVRDQRGRIVLPFRCDAPALRRFMLLEIEALADDSIEFQAHLAFGENRTPLPLLDPLAPRNDDVLHVCSMCNRFEVDDHQWIEAEDAMARLGLDAATSWPRLSHGLCEPCLATALVRVDAL